MTNRIRLTPLALAVSLLVLAFTAPLAAPPRADTAEQEKEAQADIDINKASVDELTTVTGIGRVLAERIVEFRDANGPYASVDDLLKVKGIGEKLLEKIRGRLVAGRVKK